MYSFEYIYNTWYHEVYTVARQTYKYDSSAAEDATQDFFVMWHTRNKTASYDPNIGSFAAYLMGTARKYLWQTYQREFTKEGVNIDELPPIEDTHEHKNDLRSILVNIIIYLLSVYYPAEGLQDYAGFIRNIYEQALVGRAKWATVARSYEVTRGAVVYQKDNLKGALQHPVIAPFVKALTSDDIDIVFLLHSYGIQVTSAQETNYANIFGDNPTALDDTQGSLEPSTASSN